MLEPAGSADAPPRAFLHVGGATLAFHQLQLALAMGCQRIVCIARALGAETLVLQHAAEEAGVHFNVISSARALAGLVTASDDLLVLTEGLLVAPQEAIGLLEEGNAVLVQPVEGGLVAGFERVDLNNAAAGAMRLPGRLVEGLAELPADCDVPSALTRIALQAGIGMREVPAAAREGVRWRLVRDETEAQAAEGAWIRLHMGDGETATPGLLLARLAVRSLGPALLHAGNGARNVAIAAGATMLLALGAGWFGLAAAAFLLCAIAWVMRRCAGILARIERDSLTAPQTSPWLARIIGGLLDAQLILLVVWSDPALPWKSALERFFAPAILLCLTRLLPRAFDRPWAAWLADRALVSLLLAFAAALGVLGEAVQVFALLLAAAGVAVPGARRG